MSGSRVLDMSVAHRQLVLAIVGAVLPQGARVWAFGSRTNGRARRYSDLDLAIDAGRRLTLDEAARLAEDFSDSDLPYKVDIVDWHGIDDRFRQLIATGRVPLTDGAGG